jgi:hypothetical protein
MNAIVCTGVVSLMWLVPAAWLAAGRPVPAEGKSAPSISVRVDLRVELMSVLFRLAGHPEYNQGKVPSYVQDVEEHFGRFRDHPAVKLARQLKATRGIGYNAPMSMAVHVADAVSLQERIRLSPVPESLDSRWTPKAAREFLDLARKFAADSGFQEFFDRHEPLYRVAVERMRRTLDEHAHLDWFDSFFGPRQGAEFHVVLGMLNGPSSYGAHFAGPNGQEELYSILGVWMVDSEGQPVFPSSIVPTIVHEFTHSYTNPLVDRFSRQLQKAGETIYGFVGPQMQRQAYGNWKTMMYESLVRACTLRYVLATEGQIAMQKAAMYENSRSFYWVDELAAVLAEYDTQPRKHKDLAEFFPRIIAFFDEYAAQADVKLGSIEAEKEKQMQQWREKGPQIVTMVPANGAQDVDPNLKAVVVTFDRPMRDKSWSVVTLGSMDHYPKGAGPVGYDATRTVFTMPVELQPAKEYIFGLNGGQFLGFRSEQDIPLAPVVVRFRTRPADK